MSSLRQLVLTILHRLKAPAILIIIVRRSDILLDVSSRQAFMTHLELLTRLNKRFWAERQWRLLSPGNRQTFLYHLEEATLTNKVRFQIFLIVRQFL